MDDARKARLKQRANVGGAVIEGAIGLLAVVDFLFGSAGGWALVAFGASIGCVVARVEAARHIALFADWERRTEAIQASQAALQAAHDTRREFLDEMIDLCSAALAFREAGRRGLPAPSGFVAVDGESFAELCLLCDRFQEAMAKAKRDAIPTIQ